MRALIVVNDYHLERAQAAAARIEALGVRALAVQADVGDFEQVQAMFRAAHEQFGRVDVLVNNAGNAGPIADTATHMNQFWETTPQEWQLWLHTNLYGVMMCTHAAMPGMIERQYGRIVTVISDAGRLGEPHLAVYSAAKGGAASFMRAIAKAGARYGIARQLHLTRCNVDAGARGTPVGSGATQEDTEPLSGAPPGNARTTPHLPFFISRPTPLRGSRDRPFR